MLIWIIFAGLTALLFLWLARPLARTLANPVDDAAYDQAVYRDQLAELEREKQEGLIPAAEASAARTEIARRLLSAHDAEAPEVASSSSLYRQTILATLVALPLFALGLYAMRGSPDIPGVPRAERLANAEANRDMEALIAKVESHLAAHPNDAEGWRVLAPAYRSLRRYDAAARAFAQALAFGKPDSALFADLGEVLVLGSEGLVTREALESFDDALKLDRDNPKARYYQGLASLQEGKRDEALERWRALLNDAPADAPWRPLVERQISDAMIAATMPMLGRDQLAAAGSMDDEQRSRIVRGMVDSLAQRLAQNGDDLEGWLKLARARLVLGEPQKARQALDRARELFKQDQAALARIEDMRRTLPPQ
jgi:cytochrome c-type biogenesis protein CcmH